MEWRQFSMDLGRLPADEVEALLTEHGAIAVTFSDAADDPVLEPGPGETPLWCNTRVTGLFEADANFNALLAALAERFELAAPPPHEIETLADRAWEREWLKDFRPMPFGQRLWVAPHGQVPEQVDAVVVQLDPGLAFGTGTHPTTALCLRWLDGAALDGCRVLDFGCGSGILAIAALKLGAQHADCTDIDPQAIVATRNNAADNGVLDHLDASTARPDGRYDIVLANILAAPLIENAAWLIERLDSGARLVLSGILDQQVEEVQAAFGDMVQFAAPSIADNWACLAGRLKE